MHNKTLRFTLWTVVALLLATASLAVAAPTSPPASLAPFDPYILTAIEAQGPTNFYVVLKTQADLSGAASLRTKEAKGQYVFDALTQVAAETQGPILKALSTEKAIFQPFWIRNMIRVRGDKALLLKMAARPDVAEIFYEYQPTLDVDPPSAVNASPETVEWNIIRVNADDVWALGVNGTGVVVGDLDTGVQWDHPALVNSYRLQIPGTSSRHDYNWYDGPGGSTVPLDYDTHGTHTMGTIVGDDGATNQIGMAPGARWIACAGLGASATPMDCFQWFLAPTKLDGTDPRPDLAPHVINNSWSTATDYHAIIQTLYAAGIFYAKSAGNTGSACGTITNPGQWSEVMATANFMQGDAISSSSSRGPVTIGHDVLVKPDIAAPGTSVRSSVPGGGYGYKSGTSMACPHVTGAVALLISARPDLAGQVDILQMLLKQTAEPKISAQCSPYVSHPNDVWGWGILNAYDAVTAAQSMGLGGIEGQVFDSSTTAPIADAEITFDDRSTGWQLYDMSEPTGGYSRTLPAADYDLTATHYGYLPASVSSVAVQDGVTTVQDIPLDPAPVWTVSGAVAETQTGDPLAAHINFEETPISTDTNPLTGNYSAEVAQGTWWMEVSSPGHAKEDRQVLIDQNMTQDFDLLAIDNYYMKTNESVCGPTFSWIDARGGTANCLSDDSFRLVSLPSGRSFTFYGNTYTSLYLGSNGHVTFGSGADKWSGPIPDPTVPNNGIYAFDTDLNPASCVQGTIYTQYLDNRYFVVEFYQVEHYLDGSPETFEIILDLDTGKVTIQFLTVSDPSDAVVGVENAAGTEATQYAHADPVLIAGGVAVDFFPIFSTPPPTGDPGDLEGTVTDADSSLPIAGATVTAVAFTGGEVFSYTTNASGIYSDVLCADWYSMTATAPGYRPADEVRAAVISGTMAMQDFDLIPLEADLWITKTAPMNAAPGALLTYTLSFGSLGPDEVPWGKVHDPLPAWAEYVTSTGGFYEPSEHAVTWEWFNMPTGFASTETLTVKVSSTVTVGLELCNQAAVYAINEGAPTDPNPDDNTAMACTTVEPVSISHYVYLPIVVRNEP
jgi:subtilisin family serine protease